MYDIPAQLRRNLPKPGIVSQVKKPTFGSTGSIQEHNSLKNSHKILWKRMCKEIKFFDENLVWYGW